MGEFNSRGLWAQETALHTTGYSCATTRMEWKSIRLRWDAEVLWPLPPSAGKDLGIHGQALRQTIRSVSDAAKRSSQWIWIKRKDPCWAHRTATWHAHLSPPAIWEPRSSPSSSPSSLSTSRQTSCVRINTIYWHNGQLISRPVF